MYGSVLFGFMFLFSLVVAFGDAWVVTGLVKQYLTTNYLEVTGIVTESRVVTNHSSRGGDSYSAMIAYRYSVDGRDFSNHRLRYGYTGFFGMFDSGRYVLAHTLVKAHPVGSATTVYYDPRHPVEAVLFTGVKGADFMPILFLVIFNTTAGVLVMSLYRYICERIAKPVAGGVTLIIDGWLTRVRLPQTEAYVWGLKTTGYAGLGLAIILAVTTDSNPSLALALGALGICGLAGLAGYVWRRSLIQSGLNDLVIDESAQTLDLPPTYERVQRMAIVWSDIAGLYTEKRERSGRSGPAYTYAPTLIIRSHDKTHQQTLVDWPDKLRAEDFTQWLQQKLDITGLILK